jgi:methyltransferase
MHSGAILLAYVTAQRIIELWWARRNETRLLAAGGTEYGQSHWRLMQLLHAAWLIGMWALAYGHSVQPILQPILRPTLQPIFLALFVLLQIGRFWVLATLGQRWTIRVIAMPGEKLVVSGPYRVLRHPNYAIVIGEIAVVPLALGLPLYALIFTLLNAIVLSIRIPRENAALAGDGLGARR